MADLTLKKKDNYTVKIVTGKALIINKKNSRRKLL